MLDTLIAALQFARDMSANTTEREQEKVVA